MGVTNYEYKVVPAPKKAGKIRGVKGTGNKFAVALTNLMNEYGADGWEYQRTDTLPCEERQGLTGKATTFQNVLVFRREIISLDDIEPIPTYAEPTPEPVAETTVEAPEEAKDRPAMAVPTFQSATVSTAPKISGHVEPSEGNAPPVKPADTQDVAAQ